MVLIVSMPRKILLVLPELLVVLSVQQVPHLIREDSYVFLFVDLDEDLGTENLPHCPVLGQIVKEDCWIPTVSN